MNEHSEHSRDSAPDPAALRELAEKFLTVIPHNRALGVQVISADPGRAVTRIAYRPEFLGDVAAGIWHTGPAISLSDATSGLAVQLALPRWEPIATLDLRMDYLRPALADAPLIARAECYHLTRRVAFARTTIHQGDPERATAICTATFMRTNVDKRPGKERS